MVNELAVPLWAALLSREKTAGPNDGSVGQKELSRILILVILLHMVLLYNSTSKDVIAGSVFLALVARNGFLPGYWREPRSCAAIKRMVKIGYGYSCRK